MAISSTLIKSFQLSTLATALALAGCGGGSGNDTLQPGLPTGTNPMPSPGKGIKEVTVADIAKVNVTTNLNTLTTNNGDTINVTAQVRDINNVSLASMPVTFELLDPTAATGVTATTPLQAKTNADGEAVLDDLAILQLHVHAAARAGAIRACVPPTRVPRRDQNVE